MGFKDLCKELGSVLLESATEKFNAYGEEYKASRMVYSEMSDEELRRESRDFRNDVKNGKIKASDIRKNMATISALNSTCKERNIPQK